jgi:hypothetical protein
VFEQNNLVAKEFVSHSMMFMHHDQLQPPFCLAIPKKFHFSPSDFVSPTHQQGEKLLNSMQFR